MTSTIILVWYALALVSLSATAILEENLTITDLVACLFLAPLFGVLAPVAIIGKYGSVVIWRKP